MNYIGYVKYEGRLVKEGLMGARTSAKALLGFDESIRFFVNQQLPQLYTAKYDIPIKVNKGSWELAIPETIGQWITTSAGVAVTTYLGAAAKKMADNDFKDVGLKNIFKSSLKAIQWVIKIGRHTGTIERKKFTDVKFRNENQEIGLPNKDGVYLYVPKKYFEYYISCTPKIISELAEIIENERELAVGIFEDGEKIEEKVTIKDKQIFYKKDEEEDILFPELSHGLKVELEGYTTRGNQKANNLGFEYQNHILTCYPSDGNISQYKSCLFLKCKIYGKINRKDKHGEITESRPRIIFDHLEPMEREKPPARLF